MEDKYAHLNKPYPGPIEASYRTISIMNIDVTESLPKWKRWIIDKLGVVQAKDYDARFHCEIKLPCQLVLNDIIETADGNMWRITNMEMGISTGVKMKRLMGRSYGDEPDIVVMEATCLTTLHEQIIHIHYQFILRGSSIREA